MKIARFTMVCLCAMLAQRARAQATTAVAGPADSLLVAARQLVDDGNAGKGRALVDSALAVAAPGSATFVEALYWHGVLALTAADAEQSYRRVIVEYPLAPRAEDALLRLAQLELARGDRAGALAHLQRLALEHPAAASRARASYWLGRVYLEQKDLPHACGAFDYARRGSMEQDVQLRSAIDRYSKTCAGVSPVAPNFAAQQVAPDGGAAIVAAVAEESAPPAPAPVAPPPPPPPPVAVAESARVDPPHADSGAPVARHPDTTQVVVATPPAVAARGKYTVQLAAAATRHDADALVARYKRLGLDPRIFGTATPFRVRVGLYASYAEAAAALARMKTSTGNAKADWFVTESEPR